MPYKRRKSCTLGIYISALGLAVLVGCATTSQNGEGSSRGFDKETLATIVGGIAGGLLGSRTGEGSGKTVAMVLGAVAGAYIGNRIGARLSAADRAAVETKSAQALSSTRDGQTVRWKNPDTGASAAITPRNTRQEARSVPVLRKKEVAPIPRLQLIGETWQVKTNANVRTAPSLNAATVGSLKAGDTFTAVGRVQGSDWIVVGRNGQTVGYVSGALVEKPRQVKDNSTGPGLRQAVDLDALERDRTVDLDAEGLVPQQVAVSSTCRDMEIEVSGTQMGKERQSVKACKGADGAWEIL